MLIKFLIISLHIYLTIQTLSDLNPPKSYSFSTTNQVTTHAPNQKIDFIIPKSISSQIEYFPIQDKSCQIIHQKDFYKINHKKKIDSRENGIVTAILVVKKISTVFLINQFGQLNAYSFKQQSMLKHIMTHNIIKNQQSQNNQTLSYAKLITDQQQKIIYILTSFGYFYFKTQNIGTDIKKIDIQILNYISNVELHKGYLFITSQIDGLCVYEVQPNGSFSFDHKFTDVYGIDFQIDRNKDLLFLLDTKQTVLNIYDIRSIKSAEKNNTLQKIDTLALHGQKIKIAEIYQISINKNIILILFTHNSRSIVAEFSYNSPKKTFTFIRYFKFDNGYIQQIHFVQNDFIAVGVSYIGIFQTQIHPRLIKTDQNYLYPSTLNLINIYVSPYFIGVTPSQIVYGTLQYNFEQKIECMLKQNSKLEKVIIKANLTNCDKGTGESRQYFEYCEYQKVYPIKPMDLVTTQSVANSVLILMITFCTIILGGVIIIFILRQRNIRKIKKMQLEFQQKKRTSVPPNSNRQAATS